MSELANILLINLIIAFFQGGIITGIICLLYTGLARPVMKTKQLRKAIDKGNIVIAKKIRTIYPNAYDNDEFRNMEKGIYCYEYNGKKYTYKRWKYEAEEEITLYFRRKPSKASEEMYFGYIEDEWIYIWLMCTLITFIIRIIF